jgi:hypothetical protein
MEQLSLEQIKINEEIKKQTGMLREQCEVLFDDRERLEKGISDLIKKLGKIYEAGLSFDKDGIIKGVKESLEITDKEAFVSHIVKTLKPFVLLNVTKHDFIESILEKERREEILNEVGNFKLSEVLYAGAGKNEAHIHLAPAKEFIKEKGIAYFKNEIKNGLKKLAEMIEDKPKIEKITATSWIVGKNPALLEDLGFTIIGGIPEEEKEKHFKDETRPVAKAFINREDFLKKYGKQK